MKWKVSCTFISSIKIIILHYLSYYKEYKLTIGIPFLDNLSQQMSDRFSTDNRNMQGIMALVPDIIVKHTPQMIADLIQKLVFWDCDLPSGDVLKVYLFCILSPVL